MNEDTYDLTQAKKAFSRIGWAMCAILVVATVVQLLWILVPMWLFEDSDWMMSSTWSIWLGTIVPLYGIAMPVGLLILKKLPAQSPAKSKMGAKDFLIMLLISFCLMYAGNMVGTALSSLLSGGTAENTTAELASDTNPLKVLVVVILAPLLEEFICRKQIIDRTRQYGEKTAVLLSAMVFGLFHQNLFQFFYAFALGLVFGYIYIRMGRLRYTVLLHMIINFMGSVVAPWVVSIMGDDKIAAMDPNASPEAWEALYNETLPGRLVGMVYVMLMMGMAIAGLVLLIQRRKKLLWKKSAAQLPAGTAGKTVYLNAGMVVYALLCLVSFFLALL
jgi:membrane protease YdiL (CAAX protease family)